MEFLLSYLNEVKPLISLSAFVIIYSLFIYFFYNFISRKDIVKIKKEYYTKGLAGLVKNVVDSFIYVLQNLIVIPVAVFFWFTTLSFFLYLLSPNLPLDGIILTSMAITAAIRVTSYIREDLSKDIAKLVPFALLGTAVNNAFNINLNLASIQFSSLAFDYYFVLEKTAYYLFFIVLLEFTMLFFDKIFNRE